jgi:hypothetical protein
MKIREIELSTLIKIGGTIAMLAGFMYTTQYRLNELEEDIVELQQEQKKLHKRIIRHNKTK